MSYPVLFLSYVHMIHWLPLQSGQVTCLFALFFTLLLRAISRPGTYKNLGVRWISAITQAFSHDTLGAVDLLLSVLTRH
jgi:hypothetical protein